MSSTFGNSKRTGLHAAADFGKSEVIEYLVSKGKSVYIAEIFLWLNRLPLLLLACLPSLNSSS